MDVLTLSRLQFAITTIYHFFFVPLTLGLSFLVALMETLYVRSGKELYLRMTKFWGKLFVINFALGVVTGIVQEFQFGMNWSEYSRFVGDIFGAPLAIEALLAFFLESTFLGIWIFGWDKLSKGMHAATIWMVALGSNISALWILIANSFMQEPVGYAVVNGRAVMTNFVDLVLNPNVWVMFPHTLSAGFATAAFFVMGVSAYHLLRKSHVDIFRRSFQIAAIIGTVAVVLVALNGHSQAQHMVESQPMKIAAAEALWNTESPASFSLLSIGDLTQREEVFSIRLPRLLCLLAYNRLDCEIQGIYDLQAAFEGQFGAGDYIPPVALVYWSFRVMVGVGFLMIGLALYGLFLVMGEILEERPKALKLFQWAIFLPYLANTAGWMMTELGRIPWVVYGLMTVDQGVSSIVSSGQVLVSLLGYTLVYGALMVAMVYLMMKYAKAGPESSAVGSPDVKDTLPSLVGAHD
ncbi:MAG: cytochrome D ubiquinol oxidase subunit I [Chloroflexi bacterium RBG_16_57_11]|nr:MAG: cytochrome D ubiquinol oxidase subunit I [Chloroflexi bacterium RBG_16_57_11]